MSLSGKLKTQIKQATTSLILFYINLPYLKLKVPCRNKQKTRQIDTCLYYFNYNGNSCSCEVAGAARR